MAAQPKLLFVKSRKASFIELDQQLLSELYDVSVIYQPARFSNPLAAVRAVLRADVVVGWWASWHTFLPFTLAWMIRKPSLLIIGGFDTAAEPEFGYGYQLGGVRKHLSRWIMHRAAALMTNSAYSQREIERNVGIPAAQVTIVYHGVPDTAPQQPTVKRPMALTVGIVDATNLTRKGIGPFARASALLPEIEFVIAGKTTPEMEQTVRELGGPNLRVTGWVSDEQLEQLMNDAAVYVQPSRHEGFGVSVAEAMLHRCVPVASTAGALGEVVGNAGVVLSGVTPQEVADAVAQAVSWAQDPATGNGARERVLTEFSVQQRRDGLQRLVQRLLGAA